MASYSRTELLEMVLAEGSAQRQLHAEAAAVRDKVYGKTVVVRGVIEITNVCRVNCDYCPMRRDNTRQNTSYTLQPEEILAAARNIHESGINALVLQGGEVPQTTEIVAEVLPRIRELFADRVEILLGLGIKSESEYQLLRERGADTYILKHETADADLHHRVRGESLSGRVDAIRTLLRSGVPSGKRLHRRPSGPDDAESCRGHAARRFIERSHVQRLTVRADERYPSRTCRAGIHLKNSESDRRDAAPKLTLADSERQCFGTTGCRGTECRL